MLKKTIPRVVFTLELYYLLYQTKGNGMHRRSRLSNICCLLLVFVCMNTVIAQNQIVLEPDNIDSQVDKFARVINNIKEMYVDNVSYQKLFDYAIEGMVKNLDAHSDYLDKKEFKRLQDHNSGSFVGVGMEVTRYEGWIKVISPIDDAPAMRAGIQSGDLISHIDGSIVKDMTLIQAVDKIKGKVGTQVTLTIVRENNPQPFDLKLTRELIKLTNVKVKMITPSIGYARVAYFTSTTAQDLKNEIIQEKKSNAFLKGFIIDLRNNPGGLLTSAIDLSDLFLDADKLADNIIVSVRSRYEFDDIIARAMPGDILDGLPILVMINQGSASASEIVAMALQDHGRAVVLGSKSFGKGSVQTIIPIEDGTAMKITTALYYSPKGRTIQATGVKPDVYIPQKQLGENKVSTDMANKFSEKNLMNHIKVNSDTTENSIQNPNIDVTNLAHKDFQLYQSVIFIQGLHSYRN